MLLIDILLIYILLQQKQYLDGFLILKNSGFLNVQIIRNNNNEIIERRIYILDKSVNTYCSNSQYPSCQINQHPIDLNIKNNNIELKIERLYDCVINNKIECYDNLDQEEKHHFIDTIINLQFNYTKESIQFLSDDNKLMMKYIIYFLADIIKHKKIIAQNNTIRALLIYTYNKCKDKQIKYLGTANEINNFYDYFYKSASLELFKM